MDEEDDAFNLAAVLGQQPRKNKRQNPLSIKELQVLLSETTDASKVLLQIERPDGTLEKLLKERDKRKLPLIVKVVSKGIKDSWNAQPQAVMNVLNIFKDAVDFHEQIVLSFDPKLGKDAEYIKAVLVLFKFTAKAYPNNASKLLAHIFIGLEVFIDKSFQEEEEINKEKNLVKHMLLPRRLVNEEEVPRRINNENDHNVNPNLFRELSIIPTAQDFDPAQDILYRANKTQGAYENVNVYLDIQFRLLRADLILPLRKSIMKYLQGEDDKDYRGIQVYTHVRIVRPICHDKGLCFRLSFDTSRFRRINWSVSQRLKYGSLLCLSTDNFNTYQCAVVENRDAKDLAKGLVDVLFVLNAQGPDFQVGGHEEFMRLIGEARDHRFIMVESPTYFEAYKHVLLGLQHFTENNFPFWRYIGQCNYHVDPPEYLQDGQTYDLRPLVDKDFVINDNREEVEQFSQASQVAAAVNVLDTESWPNPNTLSLDLSQYVALQSALTKEFSIIQGPPGTGKTFIGLLAMKALLHNKQIWLGNRDQSPILLVCYTNHALDQFLEGILSFFKGNLVRVGSRSKSEILEEYSLRGMRNTARNNRTVPQAVHLARQETRLKMKELKAEIHTEASKLEILEREIVTESFLQSVMKELHFETLTKLSGGHSIISRWLGINVDLSRIEEKVEQGQAYGQAQNAVRPLAGGARTAVYADGNAEEEDEYEETKDEDNDVDLLEMVNTDLPQTRHLDVDDDDDDVGTNDADDNDLFLELYEGLGEDFMRHVRHANQKLDDADRKAEEIRRNNVAFSISDYGEEEMPSGLTKDEKKHWKSIIPLKKKYRSILLSHLQKLDRMTEEEVGQIYNVWKLKKSDKWRLYRYWVDLYCRQIRGEIRDKAGLYEQTARRYQEILFQEDKTILERATIIGMTTTGAARYQGILREIGPRIVLVEEAAEVFESHVVTSLTDQCQHAIFIGDHKQLRPNPSVYELKTQCGLDISLFERLVENGFHYDCLKYQHRMRPEISRLLRIPDLYPDLEDHEVVRTYPDVIRVQGNVCFIQHDESDMREHDTNTFSNPYEAKFLIHLCEYLLLQGQFKPGQITILSPYAGQIHLIKKLIVPLAKSHRTSEKMKGVKISSVDNYQGNENDIILLSLVRSNEADEIGFLKANNRICVALSRAKIGLFVIGNFIGLGRSSLLIQEIATEAKRLGYLKDHVILSCMRHEKNPTIVRCPKDFEKVSEGGCSQPCEMRLKCGHSCKRVCHADDYEHKNAECSESCRHICEKCQQHCSENHSCGSHDFCRSLVEKHIPMCGHLQKVPCHIEPNQFVCKERCREALPCGHQCASQCGSRHDHTQDMCKVKIEAVQGACGHGAFQLECGQARNLDGTKCPAPCGTELECGHICSGTCGLCRNQRLHVDCQERCKKILICGHKCRATCSSCPPCMQPCETACAHSRCPKKCGELCARCVEPCSWKCKHESCQDLCCQPCERPQCNVQCPKRLPCGHICCGLCGEKCPRLCSICDKEKLINESLYGYDGDPTTLFIEVDCGHVVEVEFMDHWMKTNTAQSNESADLVIGHKECPRCKAPVRKCARYSTQIKKMLNLIESVKRQYIGEKKDEIKQRLEKAIAEVRGPDRLILDKFLDEENQVLSEVILEAQMNQVLLFRTISAMQQATEECMRRFESRSEAFRRILQDLDHFTKWTLRRRALLSEQNKQDAETERNRLSVLLDLHKIEETVTARGLRDKLKNRHMIMIGKKIRELSAYKRGNNSEIEECKNLCEELRKRIPDTHIALTAEEKLQIVRAVNVSQGAWYQCPNGHIYCIGECGQAMEESRCPECKAKIGGTNHHLLSDNAWAQGMDDAEQPVWNNIDADREIAMRLQEQFGNNFFMD